MAWAKTVRATLCGFLTAAIIIFTPNFLGSIKASDDILSDARLDRDLADLFQRLEPGNRVVHASGGRIVQAGDAVRVVVGLRAPASLSFSARGYQGIDVVKASVKQAQDRVLRQLRADEFLLAVRLDIQYAFAGWVTSAGLVKLLAMPAVNSIVPDYWNQMDTVEGRAMTRSDYAANTLGYTGTGNTVAMIDSAFDYLHPELGGATPKSDSNPSGSNSVAAYMKDFSGNTLVEDPGDATPDDDVYPSDCPDGYHGTGTAAIVHRYAPGAKLVLLKVFPNSYDSRHPDLRLQLM